jgi:hypothetical protein
MGCWSESCRSHHLEQFCPSNPQQLHGNLLTHYNCTEWDPPLADDAPAPDDPPAQGHDDNSGLPLSLPLLNLLSSSRVRQDEDNGEVDVRPLLPPHTIRSESTSCKRGLCMSRCCEIRLQTACVMYTCFITPNQSEIGCDSVQIH